MFKRKIYSKIKEWKDNSHGKTALLIKGTRRVGKSTVVEKFAKMNMRHIFCLIFLQHQAV